MGVIYIYTQYLQLHIVEPFLMVSGETTVINALIELAWKVSTH